MSAITRTMVFVQAYRLARRNNYGMRSSWRFAKLAVFEHPSSLRRE
jgi:hypothetical protein